MTEQTVADKENADSRRETNREPRSFRGRTHTQEERIHEAAERTMRGRKPAAEGQ